MTTEVQPNLGWRTAVGTALLVSSIGWPIFVPILPLLDVSATTTATVSGIMLVAAAVLILAGAASPAKRALT